MSTTDDRGKVAWGFIGELDGLRGIAILVVMLHRFWPQTGSLARYSSIAELGWVGVDLFFVISGFLITGILLDTKSDPHRFRNFYARRALRILPLYYLYLALVLVVMPLSQGGPYFQTPFIQNAGSPFWYLLYLGNFPETLGHDPPFLLGHLWSLAIEEQFYLAFPLVAVAIDRRRLAGALILAIALAPALRLVALFAFPDQERIQYLATPCRMDVIAAGCLLAILARAPRFAAMRPVVVRRLLLAALVIFGAAFAAGVLSRTGPFGRVLGYSIVALACGSLVLFALVHRGLPATAWLRLPPLLYMGKLGYGLYLLHRPADVVVDKLLGRVGAEELQLSLGAMAAKVAVTLVLATVSWRLLERPLLGLKRHFALAHHPVGGPTLRGFPSTERARTTAVLEIAP